MCPMWLITRPKGRNDAEPEGPFRLQTLRRVTVKVKGTQRERTVQRVAAAWLCNHLETRDNISRAKSWLEVSVRRAAKKGHGRADALIAAVTARGEIYTASLEAKSLRLLKDLSGNAVFTAPQVMVSLLLSVGLWVVLGMSLSGWWWIWGGLLSLLVAFPAVVILMIVKAWLPRRPSVVRQVKQYPAHEQWIAVSRDAMKVLPDESHEDFLLICAGDGIGLLEVSRSGAVSVLVDAKLRRRDGDVLAYYVHGEKMRQELEGVR